MNKEEMRKAFEKWYLSLHGSTRDDLHTDPEGDIHMAKGDYYDLGARMMWAAWQARQPEIDQLKEKVDSLHARLYSIRLMLEDDCFDLDAIRDEVLGK